MLRGLTARYRRRRDRRLADELAALASSARDYRLIASALGPASRAPRSRDEEERLLAIGGVGMIGDGISWVLGTLCCSLGARTVALLWVDDDGERIKLKEVVSDAEDITETARLSSAAVLGAVLRDRAPLLVAATKPGQLPYYDGGRAGVALVAVPIVEGAHLRGILAADRDTAFTEADRDLLAEASAQVLRAVQAEQVFRAVERAKYEHERFYQAAALLGRALTVERVLETAFDAAAAIVDYDAGVIALYDKAKSRHKIAAMRVREGGAGMLDEKALADLEFKDNAGLASMVVKNRHYLPAGGEPREVTAAIYTRKISFDEARSLLVLPLLVADEAIGTLTLVARAEKRVGKDVREMLAVIANQVGVSLQNGLLYRKMETMATTDGLTGLTNHRTFQERFEDLLQRAARHGHKVALLLCDVDFFKKVNDGHGHPVGDEVLRRVARVLQEVPRKIDIPARYGGEEFVVVLDNVDIHAGARGRRAHPHRDQQGRRRHRQGPAQRDRVDRRRHVPRRRPRSRDADRARGPRALSGEAHRDETAWSRGRNRSRRSRPARELRPRVREGRSSPYHSIAAASPTRAAADPRAPRRRSRMRRCDGRRSRARARSHPASRRRRRSSSSRARAPPADRGTRRPSTSRDYRPA